LVTDGEAIVGLDTGGGFRTEVDFCFVTIVAPVEFLIGFDSNPRELLDDL
jgi:hypothetical protein